MRLEPCDYIPLTVSASAVVSNSHCIVQSITLTPAAAAASITLYDPLVFPEGGTPTTTNATLVVTLNAVLSGSSVVLPLSGSGIRFRNGCVAVIAGVGATALVTSAKA